MSWTATGKRCDKIEHELGTLRHRLANRFDEIDVVAQNIEDRVGGKVFIFQYGEKAVGHPTENICDRLDSIERNMNMLVDYLQVQKVTTPKQTTYRKKGKKTK